MTYTLGELLVKVERLLDEKDITELLEQNSSLPFGPRNAALILGGVCWGLTPFELSELTTETVIAPNGEFYRIWTLPVDESFNKEEREIFTENHLVPFFQRYVELRLDLGWKTTKHVESFQGLNPKSKFFLNDSGKGYRVIKNASGYSQAKYVSDHIRRMIKRTNLHGATPASLRDSYIKMMYEAGCGWNELKKISGIKHKKTLEKKVRPHERELEKIIGTIFSRVKMPEAMK